MVKIWRTLKNKIRQPSVEEEMENSATCQKMWSESMMHRS